MDKAGDKTGVEPSERFDSLVCFVSQSKLRLKTFITAQAQQQDTEIQRSEIACGAVSINGGQYLHSLRPRKT